MTRMRALRRCTAPVLAVFLAISVMPRVVLFAHHHDHDDHEHAHAWGADAVADHDHDHAAEPHHHHHHDHDHALAGAAGLEEPDGEHGEHTHWQLPFQLSLRPPPALLFVGLLVRPVVETPAVAAGTPPAPRTVARGPPSPALV